MALLSIHSAVICGHVGNSAAVFPVQCLGQTVWAIPTVLLSNHPGHGTFSGAPLEADLMEKLIDGLAGHGALKNCKAVLTGYFSNPDQVTVAANAMKTVRDEAENPIIICDPVLGDEGKGLYVPEPVANAVRDRLVPGASIATPNAFELGWLTGKPTGTLDELCQAADALRANGPTRILLTSLPGLQAPDRIGMLLADGDGYHLVETPRLPITVNGAGDMAAALFAAHLMVGLPARQALERVADTVYAVVEKTMVLGLKELALVECRDLFANPPRRFTGKTMDLVH
ncbi:MAG: pyridoxal kinase [Pseudomonadota bacterium]